MLENTLALKRKFSSPRQQVQTNSKNKSWIIPTIAALYQTSYIPSGAETCVFHVILHDKMSIIIDPQWEDVVCDRFQRTIHTWLCKACLNIVTGFWQLLGAADHREIAPVRLTISTVWLFLQQQHRLYCIAILFVTCISTRTLENSTSGLHNSGLSDSEMMLNFQCPCVLPEENHSQTQ